MVPRWWINHWFKWKWVGSYSRRCGGCNIVWYQLRRWVRGNRDICNRRNGGGEQHKWCCNWRANCHRNPLPEPRIDRWHKFNCGCWRAWWILLSVEQGWCSDRRGYSWNLHFGWTRYWCKYFSYRFIYRRFWSPRKCCFGRNIWYHRGQWCVYRRAGYQWYRGWRADSYARYQRHCRWEWPWNVQSCLDKRWWSAHRWNRFNIYA